VLQIVYMETGTAKVVPAHTVKVFGGGV